MGNDEVLKGITKILMESQNKERFLALANGNVENNQEDVHIAEVNENNKYVTFTNGFMQDNCFMKKLGQILDYVHNNGYKTNLD